MTQQNQPDSFRRMTLKISGLSVSDKQKTDLEAAADALADSVDANQDLDPLDAEPAIVFDPNP